MGFVHFSHNFFFFFSLAQWHVHTRRYTISLSLWKCPFASVSVDKFLCCYFFFSLFFFAFFAPNYRRQTTRMRQWNTDMHGIYTHTLRQSYIRTSKVDKPDAQHKCNTPKNDNKIDTKLCLCAFNCCFVREFLEILLLAWLAIFLMCVLTKHIDFASNKNKVHWNLAKAKNIEY